MNIQIIESRGDYTLVVNAPIRVTIPKHIVHKAFAMYAHRARMGGDPLALVGNFWDDVSEGFMTVKNAVLDNPIVRTVVSAIPYGGAAMAAVDLAGTAIQAGKKVVKKIPVRARRLAKQAAKRNPKALQTLNRLKTVARKGNPVARKEMGHIIAATKVYRDLSQLQDFVAREHNVPAPPDVIDVEADDYEDEGDEA